MLGFNHTLSGSIIAVIVPAPFVPLVAFICHFILDTTPHYGNSKRVTPYNKAFKIMLLIDAILCFSGLFFSWWLFPDKWFIISVGAFFATLPDFMWLLRDRVTWLNPFFIFATKIQWAEFERGWLMELLYAFCFASALLYLA